MRYATSMPPNTKDLAINQAMVAYGNRQNATAFARANNSDLLRLLKHLMEARLSILGRSLFLHLMATGNSEQFTSKSRHLLVRSTTKKGIQATRVAMQEWKDKNTTKMSNSQSNSTKCKKQKIAGNLEKNL